MNTRGRVKASKAIALYYVQLGLNLLWTPLFFVKKQVGSLHAHVFTTPTHTRFRHSRPWHSQIAPCVP